MTRIQRKLSEDIRGVRYWIEGPEDGYCPNLRFFPQQKQWLTVQNRTVPEDERLIHGICRFKANSFLIIQAKFIL